MKLSDKTEVTGSGAPQRLSAGGVAPATQAPAVSNPCLAPHRGPDRIAIKRREAFLLSTPNTPRIGQRWQRLPGPAALQRHSRVEDRSGQPAGPQGQDCQRTALMGHTLENRSRKF